MDGFRGAAAYYAAKAGLEGMSRALVEELRPKGIRPFSVPERPRPGCGRRFQAISTSKDIPPEVAAESVEFLLAQTRRAWRETLVLCPPGGKV